MLCGVKVVNRLMIGVMIASMLLPCTAPASAENQAPVIEDGAVHGSKDGVSWSLICVSPEQDRENT